MLKRLALAAPVIGSAACWGPCPDVPTTIPVPDAGAFVDGGFFDCSAACAALSFGVVAGPAGQLPNGCSTTTVDGGLAVSCEYPSECHTGRRPEGLRLVRGAACSAMGAMLTRAAQLEAASVVSFERLARELEAHGAPARLISRARAAQADERRHARVTWALARRYGAQHREVGAQVLPVRGLEAIATENTIEGCVRETFGAASAFRQARNAQDPVLRRAMRGIAEDEASHAELSWDVARWAARCLTPAANARVAGARREAVATLRNDVATSPDPSCVALAGLPDAAAARTLVDELDRTLWAA